MHLRQKRRMLPTGVNRRKTVENGTLGWCEISWPFSKVLSGIVDFGDLGTCFFFGTVCPYKFSCLGGITFCTVAHTLSLVL